MLNIHLDVTLLDVGLASLHLQGYIVLGRVQQWSGPHNAGSEWIHKQDASTKTRLSNGDIMFLQICWCQVEACLVQGALLFLGSPEGSPGKNLLFLVSSDTHTFQTAPDAAQTAHFFVVVF